MSGLASRIDVAAITALTVSQWEGATRLNALIEGLLTVIAEALVQPLADLEAQMNLATAQGVWLDLIGQRLGLLRPSVQDDSVTRFGFDNAGVGFDQGPWHSLDPLHVNRVAVDDMVYRVLLRMQGHAILTNGAVSDLEAMLKPAFADVLVEDNADGTVTIQNVVGSGSSTLATLAQAVVRAALPATVTATFPAAAPADLTWGASVEVRWGGRTRLDWRGI